MHKRRSFLKVLLAALAFPFVGRANAQPESIEPVYPEIGPVQRPGSPLNDLKIDKATGGKEFFVPPAENCLGYWVFVNVLFEYLSQHEMDAIGKGNVFIGCLFKRCDSLRIGAKYARYVESCVFDEGGMYGIELYDGARTPISGCVFNRCTAGSVVDRRTAYFIGCNSYSNNGGDGFKFGGPNDRAADVTQIFQSP